MVTLISANKATYYDEIISKCEMTRGKLQNTFAEIKHNLCHQNIEYILTFLVKIKFYDMLSHDRYHSNCSSHVIRQIKIQLFIY